MMKARNGTIIRGGMKDNQRFDPCCSEKDSIRMEAHVLAVDDSLIDRKVIEKLLKTSSCKVTTVDSGRRALQILGLDGEMNQKEKLEEKRLVVEGEEERLKIDLIITDYCMPGMTGYELLKKIKESSVFRETPVVIMSSENIIARIHRCLEEGAEDFIVKPVKLSHVKRLLEHMTATKEDGIKIMRSEEPEPVIINNRNKRKQPDSDFSTSSDSALLSETSPPSTISSASSVSACLSPSKSPPPISVLKSLDSSCRRVKQDTHHQTAPAATANCSLLPPAPDYNNDTIDELSLV